MEAINTAEMHDALVAAFDLHKSDENKNSTPNMAAMREALAALNGIDTKGLKRLLMALVEADIFDGGQINKTISAIEKARRTLSSPPRNCDVGTAEEQTDHHREWCRRDNDSSYCCNDCRDCFARWAQMPYEAERGGADDERK